uniref:Uncharacterized protein n=1 Tax=Rhizophora mucronata TaxID=61149 RepID=A0A2P2QF04_RHIMU
MIIDSKLDILLALFMLLRFICELTNSCHCLTWKFPFC